VTAGRLPDRERADVEALVADHYLEALLDAADRHALDVPADAALDPGLRDAVRVLRRALVRVHPSFRFEERLAGRLAELAARTGSIPVVVDDRVVPFARAERPGTAPAADAGDPLLPAILAGELDPADEAATAGDAQPGLNRRPLLVGGAITSAAISLVGVAWIAWRAARPGARVVPGARVARRGARVIPGAGAGAALTQPGIGGPA
jgi:hypothetical protein